MTLPPGDNPIAVYYYYYYYYYYIRIVHLLAYCILEAYYLLRDLLTNADHVLKLLL
jgi:hypothetical protein